MVFKDELGAKESSVNVTWRFLPTNGPGTIHCWLYAPMPFRGFTVKDKEAKLDGRK